MTLTTELRLHIERARTTGLCGANDLFAFMDANGAEIVAAMEGREALVGALEPLLKAADGLSHGTDWNKGTHALKHGYRAKLLAAIPAARAAIGQALGQ